MHSTDLAASTQLARTGHVKRGARGREDLHRLGGTCDEDEVESSYGCNGSRQVGEVCPHCRISVARRRIDGRPFNSPGGLTVSPATLPNRAALRLKATLLTSTMR